MIKALQKVQFTLIKVEKGFGKTNKLSDRSMLLTYDQGQSIHFRILHISNNTQDI